MSRIMIERELRALIVEDDPNDAELLLRELGRVGFRVVHERVQTGPTMQEALARETWDIVLSDYSMPEFSALDALDVLSKSGVQIPFLIISGTIGEETAVTALQAGAQDFLVKGRLSRLESSIERALGEMKARRERQRAVDALRASEAKYRRIVETTHEGVWVLDANLRAEYLNAKMAALLGISQEDALGVSILQFLDEQSRTVATSAIGDGIPSGVPQRGGPTHHELRLVRPDGKEFWASFSTAPIPRDDGSSGTLAMVADITEQRELQAQLMVADRMASVGTLAAGVAHEINNPLAAVLMNLELALGEVAGDGQTVLREELQDARQAAQQVQEIVRDLRVFSRAQDDECSLVGVESVLDSCARMAWVDIRRRAELIKCYANVPSVLANESRLGQVFLNLMVNAIQAIEEGARERNEVRLTTTLEPGWVVAEICDTGVGMGPEVLKRLFTPFYTTKPVGVGTGLGLSICHQIISRFGGEIRVQSELGKGSTFRVRLPRARI